MVYYNFVFYTSKHPRFIVQPKIVIKPQVILKFFQSSILSLCSIKFYHQKKLQTHYLFLNINHSKICLDGHVLLVKMFWIHQQWPSSVGKQLKVPMLKMLKVDKRGRKRPKMIWPIKSLKCKIRHDLIFTLEATSKQRVNTITKEEGKHCKT